MTNLEKYNQAFIESLEVTEDQLNGLQYQQIPNWDSVGHMGLIAAIEDAFDIEIENEDAEKIATVGDAVEQIKNAVN